MVSKLLKFFGSAPLFWVALPICAFIAIIGISSPATLEMIARVFTRTAFSAVDWFFMVSVTGFLILIIWLAFGPYGRLKLGRPEDEPEFSTLSWLAMLFSAGMGVGLLFWGAAEPITHFINPPIGEGGTANDARNALVFTSFHWGLHAWAVYGIGALILAYFGFRHRTPYLAGSPIRYAFRGKWVEPVSKLADLVAVLGVATGVAGSLGMGVMQIQSGLHIVAGTSPDSTTVSIAILAVLVVGYMTSAATSIDKGIKWLSNINMVLAVFLLVYILVTGPTGFLLGTFTTSLGDYISAIPSITLQVFPFSDADEWIASWTLTYFIWWIAWAPFVGIFIARISRGRTFREFVIGVLFTPTIVSILWFSVFGGGGLYVEMHGGGGVAEAVAADVTSALFVLFEHYPGTWMLGLVSSVLVFIFVVTSADSATFVLGMLTSKGSINPPTSRKLSWGVSLGAMSMALLLSGNVEAVKAVAVLGAVPFVFILTIQAAALLRTLPKDLAEFLARKQEEEEEEESCD